MEAIYETATGTLVSTASDIAQVANPLPAGLTRKTIADPPDGYLWSVTLLDFVAPPAPRKIGKYDFISRFTIAERKELFGFSYGTTYTAAQQKNLANFMRYLDFLDIIDLDDTAIQTGVNYLETTSIIAAGRAAQVLG
jgi:hypothetical protein